MIIVVSLLMSSIIKLRWINLAGALIFCVYGFLINAAPVCASNAAGHFCYLIRVCGSLYVWYVFLNIVAEKWFGGSVKL